MAYVLLAFFCLTGPKGSVCDSAVPSVWFSSPDYCQAYAISAYDNLEAVAAEKGFRIYVYQHLCIEIDRSLEG